MDESITKRWNSLTRQYNQYRPVVPDRLISILVQLSRKSRPGLVVDLGCGTGNSTQPWQERAQRVIGIDPSEEMISTARELANADNISYIQAFANNTNLENHCADVVVSSSAVHWMDPETTLKEIKRILKPDGLFAFWGTSHPPVTPFMEMDQAYFDFVKELDNKNLVLTKPRQWKWEEILSEIRKNNYFRLHRFFHIDQNFQWGSIDYVNWLYTTNEIPALIKKDDPKFTGSFVRFNTIIDNLFGGQKQSVFFVYSVHVFKS